MYLRAYDVIQEVMAFYEMTWSHREEHVYTYQSNPSVRPCGWSFFSEAAAFAVATRLYAYLDYTIWLSHAHALWFGVRLSFMSSRAHMRLVYKGDERSQSRVT